MKIEKIEIRKIFLPFVHPFETSGWRVEGNNGIIIRIFSEGTEGWGEIPVSLKPYYLEETTGTVWSVLEEVLIPEILKKEIKHPFELTGIFSSIRGNRMAISGIDFALWDLLGKIEGKSITKLLGGTKNKIEAGVSIGIQKDIKSLLISVGKHLDEGYKRIKIKIKPGWDLKPVEEIRKKYSGILLQVDANCAYKLNDSEHLSKLDEYNLLLIEQPLAYNDLFEHSKLQKKIKTPVCLDESIISPDHARWAIEAGSCKIINIKPSRVGGLTAAKKIHDIAEAAGILVWCGGMLETGIGRSFNTALASLPNFKLPGDISASNRYFKKDIVSNPFVLNSDSTLNVPDQPGSGIKVDLDFLEKITQDKKIFKA